ncbi:hypothetical protein [Halobellus salinisoli]|uniref:hypothetical protein n=1 Tax=Halobellus salinisoli TaxID=3108500 RepID=UPI00300BD028
MEISSDFSIISIDRRIAAVVADGEAIVDGEDEVIAIEDEPPRRARTDPSNYKWSTGEVVTNERRK